MPALLVLCTCPDVGTAKALAESLVEARLAACVNIVPGLHSIYRWEGRVERAEEALLLIKTAHVRFDDLQEHIVRMHPYALPEVLAFETSAGLGRYLRWVDAETAPPGTPA